MNLKNSFKLNLGKNLQLYYDLLLNEDFDFKNKNISVKISKEGSFVLIDVEADSILELKIADSAIIKTLEIIDKTLNI